MKPIFVLRNHCHSLRWDDHRSYWYCGSTGLCKKSLNLCPLVEATSIEVQKGNVILTSIKPDSIRNAVLKYIEFNSKQLFLNFDEQ